MYLQKIVDYKKLELEQQKRRTSLKDVQVRSDDTAPALDFRGALQSPGVRVIAEVKKASPSAGVIRADFDPLRLSQEYEENGAAALSVLTDEHFFQGSLEVLEKIRRDVPLPILRKDFTLDAYQVYEARGAGADAVLLIARILEDSQMKDYADLAAELGMVALVEVHDREDMHRVRKIGGACHKLVGVNNRDLNTFKTHLQTTLDLMSQAPEGATIVSESGISSRQDIETLRTGGVSAFLIGESLLRAPDVGQKLRELLGSRVGAR